MSRLSAAVLGLGAGTGELRGRAGDGRRRADVRGEEHHRERGQLEGPHDARRRGARPPAWSRRFPGAGPFTVFAPVNAAFDALPAGTVDNLLKPDMKDTLTKVLTYHVVAGNYSAADLMEKAKAMGGELNLRPSRATPIPIQHEGNDLWVFDQSGKAAKITIADVNQSNGVIHVIDKVLMMKM